VELSAKNNSKLFNSGGAISFDLSGPIIPHNGDEVIDGNPIGKSGTAQQRTSANTMAGALVVNEVSRQTANTLKNIHSTNSESKSLHLISDTSGASTTAIAISGGLSSGSKYNAVGSLALAMNLDITGIKSTTKSTIDNADFDNFNGNIDIIANESADATTAAGCLGISFNPNDPANPLNKELTSNTLTFGASAAINSMTIDTAAQLINSNIVSVARSSINLNAKTQDVNLSAVAVSGALSSSYSATADSSYAIAGSGSGASNYYTNNITSELLNSSISTQVLNTYAPEISVRASSGEKIQAIAGGLDVALARATDATSTSGVTSNGTLSASFGCSVATNQVSGIISSKIDQNTSIAAKQIMLESIDGSQLGAYAIAGVASGVSYPGNVKGFGAVGAVATNNACRPVRAMIGDSEALQIGKGKATTESLSIKASRSSDQKLIADTGSVVLAAARSTTKDSLSVGIAGGVAINNLSGHTISGVYSISDLVVTGNTEVRSLISNTNSILKTEDNVYSFAGGFAASFGLAQETGSSYAMGVGIAVAQNIVNDNIKAQINTIGGHGTGQAIGSASKQLTLGNTVIEARNERTTKAISAGAAIALTGVQSNLGRSLAIGVSSATNNINTDVSAVINLDVTGSNSVVDLNMGGTLKVNALDIESTESHAIAVSIGGAAANGTVALSGGGSDALNRLSGETNATISAANYSNKNYNTSLQASSQILDANGKVQQTRKVISSTGTGALSLGFANSEISGGLAIGVAKASNLVNWNSDSNAPNGKNIKATLKASNINAQGGIYLAAVNGDRIEATTAAVSVGFAKSQSGNTVSITAAGANATNIMGTSTQAQVYGRANGSINAKSIDIRSVDCGSINSLVAAISVSGSYAGSQGASVAPAIGLALANNTISGSTETLVTGFTSVSTTNGIWPCKAAMS
jgi:hypothetical protein